MVSCRVGVHMDLCFFPHHMFVSVQFVCRLSSFAASLCGPWVRKVAVSVNSIIQVDWR